MIKDTVIRLDEKRPDIIGLPGVGKKFFGKRIRDNRVGIVKYSLLPNNFENINEVVFFELGKLLGVKVCEASLEVFQNESVIISCFEYDIWKEKVRFAKDIFDIEHFCSNFTIANLEKMFNSDVVDDFNRMVILDTITHNTDRHIRNFGFLENSMYLLFDNGKSLFWDKSSDKINADDIISSFYKNEHGFGWDYLDGVLSCQECRRLIKKVSYSDVYKIFCKYYNVNRANVLSVYVYKAYCLIMGYKPKI